MHRLKIFLEMIWLLYKLRFSPYMNHIFPYGNEDWYGYPKWLGCRRYTGKSFCALTPSWETLSFSYSI